ncbi:MAG TPA: hypothetical protein VJ742_12545 [Nitrososphaera sp.]|nr:hypothetical protein [Nitrososphaera sp.]
MSQIGWKQIPTDATEVRMLGVDYTRYIEQLGIEREFHVVLVHRYDDDNDGIWGAHRVIRPGEDLPPYQRTWTLGLLTDHNEFRKDLTTLGFRQKALSNFPEDFQKSLSGCFPIEWHSRMDELASRVQIYSRD